jgi:hypothetical protein
MPGSLADGAVEDHEPLHLAAEGLEPFRGREHHPLGMLVGGRRGEHHHVVPARGGEQAGVEGAALRPLAPPNQGQQADLVHEPLLHAGREAGFDLVVTDR